MVHAPFIHEIKRIGDKVVKKYSVAATDLLVYDAWEPSAIMGRHSTITTIEGRWYGRVGTRYLTPDVEALPPGDERSRVVGKWHEDQYEEAYRLIIQAFPEATAGKRSMGEITLRWTGTVTASPERASSGRKPWLPVPDPLGIIERATEDAPVQLRDPIRNALPVTKRSQAKLTRDDVRVEVWEERDRLHIGIQVKETGAYIDSWWDDNAREMFEDGFFKQGRGLKESVLAYAEDVGLLARESRLK